MVTMLGQWHLHHGFSLQQKLYEPSAPMHPQRCESVKKRSTLEWIDCASSYNLLKTIYLSGQVLNSRQDLMSARPHSNPKCMCRLESLTRLTKLPQITQLGKLESKNSDQDNRPCSSPALWFYGPYQSCLHVDCRLPFGSVYFQASYMKHHSK